MNLYPLITRVTHNDEALEAVPGVLSAVAALLSTRGGYFEGTADEVWLAKNGQGEGNHWFIDGTEALLADLSAATDALTAAGIFVTYRRRSGTTERVVVLCSDARLYPITDAEARALHPAAPASPALPSAAVTP